jgi:anthranilate 1,2-dioxygenase small subunit/terephthalate 1,2-dioxygenase oxygenase component beta subunit
VDDAATLLRLSALNAAYGQAIDADALEDWPGFFLDDCVYKVTTADNFAAGMQAGAIHAVGKAMLRDRVTALRKANIYERQRYRHVIGLPVATAREGGLVVAQASFLVARTMRDGRMDLFAAGVYRDKVSLDGPRALLAERIVVCDSQRFDTLLAIPL